MAITIGNFGFARALLWVDSIAITVAAVEEFYLFAISFTFQQYFLRLGQSMKCFVEVFIAREAFYLQQESIEFMVATTIFTAIAAITHKVWFTL